MILRRLKELASAKEELTRLSLTMSAEEKKRFAIRETLAEIETEEELLLKQADNLCELSGMRIHQGLPVEEWLTLTH